MVGRISTLIAVVDIVGDLEILTTFDSVIGIEDGIICCSKPIKLQEYFMDNNNKR